MILYAKIENEETGLCTVGTGTNNAFYRSMGMQPLEVQQSDVDGFWYLKDKCPMKTDEEKAEEERARINLLSMTKREMFLGLYQAKGITPEDLKAQITDPQALIEFEYANDYFRGNPLIDVIGSQLGFTTEQLDKFFETKDYTYLIPSEPVSEQVNEKSDQVSDQVTDIVTDQVEETYDNTTDTAE